jgi:ABC-2 type transport system permease protein
MTSSFKQLFLMNLRSIYRNTTGIFFTIVMPSLIYVALSVLPIGGEFGSGDVNYSQYVLPGMIAMTIMQGGIYGLAYWMIDLKARGVIRRFLVTPLKQSELIISVLASRVIIALGQAVFLTLVGVIFFDVTVAPNVLLVFVIATLGASIFLLIGLLISMFADTYEAAAPITTAVGLPLTFLGNIFFPTDSLPAVLRYVGEVLPITYLADGIRTLFLTTTIPAKVWVDIGILLAWFVVILAITLWKFRLKE